MKKQPRRLTNEQFIRSEYPLHLYCQKFNHRWELHWHEFYELCFVLSGEGTNIVNGVPHELARGSMFLLTPADFHEIYPRDGQYLELFNVVFSHEVLSAELQDLLFQDGSQHAAQFAAPAFAEIEREFRLIGEELRNSLPGHFLVARGALERILIFLTRRGGPVPPSPPPKPTAYRHDAIHKALVYVQHHFREPLTLEHAARQAQLAPNYFSECFHRMTGCPFQNYLQTLRLQFAKSLLSASDIPVTEICEASGFNTLTHFERAFKRKFHLTPREFRKKSRG